MATDASQFAEIHKLALLGRMLAAVVHELNTPLGALTSNADIISRSVEALKGVVEPSAKALGLMDGIGRLAAVDKMACERMAAVVRSLRTFSRPGESELRAVQIRDVIEDALKLAQWIYGQRIAVERDFGAVPEVECHPQALTQVFLNLLVNAGQAIEGQGAVTVRTRAEGAFVHIAVSDTGKGIRPEDRPKIFSRGFSTKPPEEGTGLGLSIARDIVVGAHGGALDFESRPGAGATFHVRLPIRQSKTHAD